MGWGCFIRPILSEAQQTHDVRYNISINIPGMPMPRTRKKTPWTPAHVKSLRRLAGRKTVAAIGRELKRTAAAVRFKAHTERISLAMK